MSVVFAFPAEAPTPPCRRVPLGKGRVVGRRNGQYLTAALAALVLVLLVLLALPQRWANGQETSADLPEFQYPSSIAVAPSGVVYLADRDLPGIWKIDQGKRSLYYRARKQFGTPLNAIRFVAIDADGQLLAGDSGMRDVFRFSAEGVPEPLTGKDGKKGQIGIPMAAVPFQGSLLIADLEAHRIWKLSGDAGLTPFADVPAPTSLAVDSEGSVWILSRGPKPLWRVSSQKGAKPEPVRSQRDFRFPQTLLFAPDGRLLVIDSYARCVWHVPETGPPEVWAKGFQKPTGAAFRNNQLLVVDPGGKGWFEVDADRTVKPGSPAESSRSTD